MPESRHCIRCGIQTEYSASIDNPVICQRCLTRAGSRWPVILAGLIICVSVGFLAGRYLAGAPSPRIIGDHFEISSEAANQNQTRVEASTGSETPIISDTQATGADMSLRVCGAPTKSGKPCQRKVRGPGYCYQHRGTEPAVKSNRN